MSKKVKQDWEVRCAALYQVIGTLSSYSGTFGLKDIDDALDVAAGAGDVDALLPWPKDIAKFAELEAICNPKGAKLCIAKLKAKKR